MTCLIETCKKDSRKSIEKPANQTALQIKSWLLSQKDSLSVKNLINSANWETAHIIPTNNGKSISVVKLNFDQIFDDQTKSELRYLVLTNENNTIQGDIYDFFFK